MPSGLEHATYHEVQALINIREATGFEDWHSKSGWDNECLGKKTEDTVGVTLEHGHVTKLDLSYNGLVGDISGIDFKAFRWLRELLLNGNNLYGSLPESVHACHKLSWLNFSDNHFTGPIPDRYDDLMVCEVFKAANNELEGTLVSSSRCSCGITRRFAA
jgi:hypothetical protein